MSTNGTSYTTIAENLGDLPEGTTSWSSTYTGYSATGSGFLRFRVIAKDSVENTLAVLTAPLNTGAWSVYAGTNDLGNGGTALSARLVRTNNGYLVNQLLATVGNGDLFISDGSSSIRKVDSSNGIITRYLQLGTQTGVPGPVANARIPSVSAGAVNMISDGQRYLYIASNSRIYRVDTQTDLISVYAGGGSNRSDGQPAAGAAVFHRSRLAYDRTSSDLYYMASCIGTDHVSLFKMNQNPDGTAGVITHIAGNCESGIPLNNADARTSPLQRKPEGLWITSMAFASSVNALYLSIYTNIGTSTMKIIDGLIFSKSDSHVSSIDYSFEKNKVIFRNHVFTPTNQHMIEATELEIGSSTSQPGCHEDGIHRLQACVNFYTATTGPSGDFIFTDGFSVNSQGSFRVRTYGGDGLLRTLAGAHKLSGHDQHGSVSRFGHIRQLHYKTSAKSNLDILPAGLYFGDGEAISIGRIDPVTEKMHVLGGSQISQHTNTGNQFTFGSPLGTAYNGTSASIFAFDPTGLITFYSSAHRFYRVTDQLLIFAPHNSGSSNFLTAAAGTAISSINLFNFGARFGMTFDASGRLYSGGISSLTPNNGAKLYMMDFSSSTFTPIIGSSSSRGHAPDDNTPGSALGKTLNCAELSHCYVQYDDDQDRLLFSEGSRIRTIASPYDTAVSALGTLKHADGVTSMNAGRDIRAYVYDKAVDRVYYLSNGALYCYDLAQTSPPIATCNNNALALPSGLGTLLSDGIAKGENNDIYVTTGSVILKYSIQE
jgi:hypothetical protein